MANLVRPTVELPPEPQRGIVHKGPAGLKDDFTVVVPGFDEALLFEIRRWMPRGEDLPLAGDEVLIVRDDAGEPWVVAWWPS